MSPEPEEVEVETAETVVPQEPDKPRRIEIDPDELKEMRETLRRQSEELHQHKLWQMQQYQQTQKPADVQVDPDVERVIAPVVQKALRPLEERNRQLEAQLQQNADQLRVQANIDYLERNIDNFEEIRPDIAKKIESLPKAEQEMVLGSPTLILEIANGINARRGRSTKQDSRSRSFSESSTGTSPSKNSSANLNIDWGNLTDAEFAAQEAKIEQARRRR
jgi:hypothetical protein